jgi:2Fe-2S ferredoxin
MPKVNFHIADLGQDLSVEAEAGASIMRTAVDNDVPGIIGECGGEMSCGTCHVYVQEPWATRLAPPGEEESAMLDVVEDPQPDSRLGCQIPVTGELDGITVTVPHS